MLTTTFRLLSLLVAILYFLTTAHLALAQEATIPETPAGKRLAQLLAHINAEGDVDDDPFLRDGFQEQDDSDVEERRQKSKQIRAQLGRLALEKVSDSSEHTISAVCHASSVGMNVLISIEVADEEPFGISEIAIEAAGDDSEPGADYGPLTAEQKQETIAKLVEQLTSKYVFPEVAGEMSEHVETLLEDGSFDEFDEDSEFARALTEELRSICNDKHLRIRAGGIRRPDSPPGRRETDNHGFVKAEMLPGGIGYLKFNFFAGNKAAEETASAAMNFLGNSRAIIFDLRENGGGSPDMIAFLSGYLFDESVHLNSFYNRPTDTTTETWSRDDVPGKRLGESVPVFVLTSNYTFSGAEEFSYNLKNMNRGVIIGETTGGGAHPVMPVSLGERFSMSMPFARAINPITETNWEGVGVEPDVKVAADDALEKAVELASKAIAEPSESTTADSEPKASELMTSADSLMNSGNFAKAVENYREVVGLEPENEMAWFRLGYCLHAAGELDEAIEIHKKASEFNRIGMVATYNLGCAYALKGNTDLAFEALDKAIEKGFEDLNQVENDPDLDSLRSDDRYETLLNKLGG